MPLNIFYDLTLWKNNTIAESSYQTKSLPLQIIKNFQYKQSRGTMIANIPMAKQEGSSNLDQVAYDDSSDAVHNTRKMNAEGNAKQQNVCIQGWRWS